MDEKKYTSEEVRKVQEQLAETVNDPNLTIISHHPERDAIYRYFIRIEEISKHLQEA